MISYGKSIIKIKRLISNKTNNTNKTTEGSKPPFLFYIENNYYYYLLYILLNIFFIIIIKQNTETKNTFFIQPTSIRNKGVTPRIKEYGAAGI